MARLTVLYDEGCGFCTSVAARVARRPGIAVEPIGSPAGALMLRDLSTSQRYSAFHVVDALGRRSTAGAALAPLLHELPAGALPAAVCRAFPWLGERLYRLVSGNRPLIAKLTGL
jgi:predicted DCC family thiol-disulfide oxidoreductase YuxK